MEPPVFTSIFDDNFSSQSTGDVISIVGESNSENQEGYFNKDGVMFVGQALTDEER